MQAEGYGGNKIAALHGAMLLPLGQGRAGFKTMPLEKKNAR